MPRAGARKPGRSKSQANDPPPVDRLRKDIDRGTTGEKVPYPDPAAAPMGTDDEAAGTPPSARQKQIEVESRPAAELVREPRMRAVYAYLGAAAAAAVLLIAMAFLLD